MTLEKFLGKSNITEKSELEKVKYLSYYYRVTDGKLEFAEVDIEKWFVQDLHHSKPNIHRLKSKLLKSIDFLKGSGQHFKLNPKTFQNIENEIQLSTTFSEDILTSNSILPESLYRDTRGFIESLAKQINASYENNIFDGCAVLMRRLLEVCLILSYQKLGIESEIQGPDNSFIVLDGIINNAILNRTLALSKDSRSILHDYKTLGNFSAHKIYYNCRKTEIEKDSKKFRAAIEEFFYKAGLKK